MIEILMKKHLMSDRYCNDVNLFCSIFDKEWEIILVVLGSGINNYNLKFLNYQLSLAAKLGRVLGSNEEVEGYILFVAKIQCGAIQ